MSASDINKGTVDSETGFVTATVKKSTKSSLVELKNGKVVFKQKCTSFEKLSETLQEIVKFREMLDQHIASGAPPLIAIPDEHKPLIAKLAHESDKTLPALVKHVHRELLPTDDDGGASSSSALLALSLNVVEAAIKAIVARNNYGLDRIPGGGKPPAAVCVWRWEVKEQHRDWLPKIAREKAETRLAERAQAKKDVTALFEALSQEERDTIFDPKGTGKLLSKETGNLKPINDQSTNNLIADPALCSSQNSKKKKSEDEENDVQCEDSGGKVDRPKKQINPEKAAKEKEKLEKKAAKAEREKKEMDARNKSRSLMANFFGKAKNDISRTPYKDADLAVAGPSSRSEFERTFKPFVLKKDIDLAPVNWFLEENHRRGTRDKNIWSEKDVIAIDDDEEVREADVEKPNVQEMDADVSQLSEEDHLRSILSSLPPSVDPSRIRRPSQRPVSGIKSYSPLAVRDILSQLSEAEIAGDIPTVRSLLSKLRDRCLLPVKVAIFADDARPGYFGTWTRSSRIIGPRTPFARDVLVFDYGYDSGEEWEEEAAGEADDVVDDGDDEDADAEDPDSDLDSWLVDDDDVQETGTMSEERAASPSLPDFPVLASVLKRKAEGGERKLVKRRKAVVPLIPFAKGPCWESTVGRCEYDMFKPYRIQLFNDTPFPIDPFTFVSNPIEEKRATSRNIASSHAVFAVPFLPDRLALPYQTAKPVLSTGGSLPSTPVPVRGTIKRTVPIPKTSFPDAHLPFLLTKIRSLQAASMTFLVEAIYQELREHKVKKNAIEAKVKEVGEKCKEKKVWVIKQGVQLSQPLVQP